MTWLLHRLRSSLLLLTQRYGIWRYGRAQTTTLALITMLKHGPDHPSASDFGSLGSVPTAFARAELGGRLPGSAQAVGFAFSSVRWECLQPFMPVCGRARTVLDSLVSLLLFVIWPLPPFFLCVGSVWSPSFLPAGLSALVFLYR